MFTDRTLTCRMCQKPFVFSADEQAFYAEKGIQRDPDFCRDCRVARRQQAYKDALADPAKRFYYRCKNCRKVFVMIRQLPKNSEPMILCPDCVPVGTPPFTNDDRQLNAALGLPRHLV